MALMIPRSLNFFFISGWARMVSAQLSNFLMAGLTHEVNGTEGQLLLLDTHPQGWSRWDNSSFPIAVVIKKGLEALWFLRGVWTPFLKWCTCLHQALGHLILKVVVFHHWVENPSVSLRRCRNSVGAWKGKKRRLSLKSHCREWKKFRNTKSHRKGCKGARKLEGRELFESVRMKSSLSLLISSYMLHPTKKNTNRAERLFKMTSGCLDAHKQQQLMLKTYKVWWQNSMRTQNCSSPLASCPRAGGFLMYNPKTDMPYQTN